MTRILSELLGAREPAFQQGLQQLEKASGGASEDIRLTAEIMHGMQDRLRQLGLDPHDTTGRELYNALLQRVKEDNQLFQGMLGLQDGDGQLTTAIERFITNLDMPREVFAIKAVAAKRLLRKHVPKKAMKSLGYRSVESMLKHEPVSLVFTAAHLVETVSWHRAVQAAYKKLSAGDFECRELQILAPVNSRWESLAAGYVQQAKQNIVGLREFGTVVLLPLPSPKLMPEASGLAATLLALQAVNDIAAASSYLKMRQVRPDFGSVVADIARNEPLANAEIAGSALPWKVVHHYFARHPEAYNPHIFEPHVHPDDLRWHSAEDILGNLHPRFTFWQDASYLGLLSKGEAVSMNVIDAVLNFCNKLPYEKRFVRYVRSHIWQELMLRYMRQSNIERSLHRQLSDDMGGFGDADIDLDLDRSFTA